MSGAPRTNYEAIAPSYDEDRKHWEIPADDVIAAGGVRDVLDVGCGTALWIGAQRRRHPSTNIRWTGLDPSAGMLAEARRKESDLHFVNALAEAVPFAANAFDYVYSSFVYHHFTDKEAAFDEITRVLRPGGTFRIRNIDPSNMEGWWVYRFFPRTRALDEHRFWTSAAIRAALVRRGFDVDVRVERDVQRQPVAEILEETERRVVSQLAILDDESYEAGLDALRAVPARETIETHWANLTLTARYSSTQTRS